MQSLTWIGTRFVRVGSGRSRRAQTLLGFLFVLCAIFSCVALPSVSAKIGKSKTGKSKTAPPDLTPSVLSQQAWAILDEGAASHSLRKRTDVIAALSSMQGDDKAIKLIENGLVDKNLDVRRIAASALGNMDAKEAIPALKKATDDPDPTVSFAAAEALWKMGDRSGAEIFYAVVLGNRHAAHGPVSSNIEDAKKTLHDPKALALIGLNEGSGALLGQNRIGPRQWARQARTGGQKLRDSRRSDSLRNVHESAHGSGCVHCDAYCG